MKTASQKRFVILSVILCCIAMSIVDGVIRPGYAVKSAVKIALFLLIPLSCFLYQGNLSERLRSLFIPRVKTLLVSLAMGAGVFGLVMALYYLFSLFIDIPGIALELTALGGVDPENFGVISIYIALVNSLLEEFFFRGFAFLTLKNHASPVFAYLFSASMFAVYHLGMMVGSMHPLVLLLALAALIIAGLMLNFINEKSGNIIASWLVHMFANFAINTVGFMVFGML